MVALFQKSTDTRPITSKAPTHGPSLKTSQVRRFVDCILVGDVKTLSRKIAESDSRWRSQGLLCNPPLEKLSNDCNLPLSRSASLFVIWPFSNLIHEFRNSAFCASQQNVSVALHRPQVKLHSQGFNLCGPFERFLAFFRKLDSQGSKKALHLYGCTPMS